MNKASLIHHIAERTTLSRKQIEEVLDCFKRVAIEELQKGGEVTLTGFFSLCTRTRHARKGVNPHKPEERIDVPEMLVAKFKAGKNLKEALKKSQAVRSKDGAPVA